MTPELEAEIRKECPCDTIEACSCHDEKKYLLKEIDRLRGLLKLATGTIHGLGEALEWHGEDYPDSALDWKSLMKDENLETP